MSHGAFEAEVIRTANCTNRIYDQHCHSRYELLFVLKGSIRLNIEGEHILLGEGSGIVIEPLKYHIVTGNNTAYHRLVLFFEADSIPLQIRRQFLDNLQQNYVFYTENLAEHFQKYASILERKNSIFAPLLDAILTEAIYGLAADEHGHREKPDTKRTGRIKQIISIIDENLGREILLEDIASRMYMSESAVCHLFKEEMNISLKQYILQKKMTYAKSLLNRGVPPGEVALACGYKNYASFYKMFIKVTGKNPGKLGPEA